MPNHETHRSLVEALQENAASSDRGFAFVGDDGSESSVSFAELLGSVASAAAELARGGVRPGDPVALVVPDNREFVVAFLAAVWAGAVPVPLYPPASLGKLDAYVEFIGSVLQTSGARRLVTPQWADQALGFGPRFAELLEAVLHTETLAEGTAQAEPAPRAPEQTAFLQFTSGSTGRPKGVVVTDASLWANAKSFTTAMRCTDEDRFVSWLPLYHDMGLIGHVLGPVLFGIPATYLPTLAFLRDPGVWLDAISRGRGTISFAPNFAYALTAKKAKPPEGGWDLSSMRVFGCGAEPINAGVLDGFVGRFAPHGVRPEAVMPAYGMAEATLAITFGSPTERFRRLEVAGAAYHGRGRVEPVEPDASGEDALVFVSCGSVLDGEHAVRVVDDEDRELPEGQVGDVQFRGPSVAAGYFGNPEATEAAFLADGWLRTGDRGFVFDGELYVTGRKKDVLVVNGRNYDPMQVEWAVEEVDGVRKGNVVAFSVPGEATEQVVVALEESPVPARTGGSAASGGRGSARDEKIKQVRRAVSDRTRLALADIVLLSPGQLPKTSSGKVQRSRTRELYLRGELAASVVATRTHAHAEPART
ncbi:fatty acyl-AMP ligase [Segniliparus rugosus]|uniref:AMP-dependent synthetase/ligase domain-containing protein n=1 Tax=Segniliparus rugosus (strain ATCC BAA-974 / DSM 45345 / CCUG 50838 / CIP 108380 / JCM 13579 / CDC 945) TaxID=679197 RepID=E5XKV9_SEGRC|nr:fatty acyl-AMP ligase [Segniliparus rugosus]EFV15016.1 hypothetical protein HMPREF9336_00128 [Segniliparus rugosus ATCC BAA-974]